MIFNLSWNESFIFLAENQYGMVDSGLASVGIGCVGLFPFVVVAADLASV